MSSKITIPKTMKAILVEETGGPEKCVLRDIPVPTPKEDEVLIKVEWSGVNYIDNYFRSGLYPKPLPFIQGQDVVGRIVSLPTSSEYTTTKTSLPTLALGQRVFNSLGNSFAEYQVAPWWKVAPLPDDVDPKDGVSLGTQALTALYLLKESYEVKKGDWILVRAAAGGVGLLLCQLARSLGANIIGTTSSEEKAELAKANGANYVLLTTNSSEDNVKEIMRLTGDKGVHVVYDGVGKDTWEEDFEVTRHKATIVFFGNASGPVPPFAPSKMQPKSLKTTRPTLGSFIPTPEDFARYAKMAIEAVQSGALKFTVHKVYNFTGEDVAQSQRDISGRGTTGKLLIKVSE